MKKGYLLVASLLIATITFSQKISFGIRGGLNVATVSGTTWSGITDESRSPRISFNLGLDALYHLNDKMGVQAELFYSGEGFTVSANADSYFKYSYQYSFLSLPVFFKYNFNKHFYVMGGPQLSYSLGAKENDERYGGTQDVSDYLNKLGVGLVPAVGYDLNKFSFGVRYYSGLTRLLKNEYEMNIRSQVFSVVVSYKVFNVKD